MNPFAKAAQTQTRDYIKTIQSQGGVGILTHNQKQYEVKRLNLSEPGFAVFETTDGLYMKVSGNYTFTTISKNA